MQYKASHPVTRPHKTNTYNREKKYSRIIDAFKHYKIINENSDEKVTVKFNNGGILYIEVEEKKVLK